MARDARSLGRRSRMTWGLVCIGLGCYPLSVALGLLSIDPAQLNAPMWVLGLSGFVFVIGGCMFLLAEHSRVNDLLATGLCVVFAVIGVWASLFSPDTGWSGGLWFLSYEQNVLLGRWVMGFGAVISASIAAYALRRATQTSR